MSATRFYTPRDAEAAFYRALETRDLEAMMVVWADDPDIVCIHPDGGALVGPARVRSGWGDVFRHASPLRVVVEECSCVHDRALALHVVREHLRLPGHRAGSPTLATNVYRLTPDGWRMLVHHVSRPPKVPAPSGTVFH